MLKKKCIVNILSCIICIFLLIGCNDDENPNKTASVDSFDDIVASDDFDWSTSKLIEINVKIDDFAVYETENVNIKIYDKNPLEGGIFLDVLNCNSEGVATSSISATKALKSVFVTGWIESKTVAVVDNKIDIHFTSSILVSSKGENTKKVRPNGWYNPPYNGGFPFQCPDYNRWGRPYDHYDYQTDWIENYIVHDYNFENGLVSHVYEMLPESHNAIEEHPEYFVNSNQPNIYLVEDAANVSITFVYEGAGNRNVLGYYTYTGEEPELDDIFDEIRILIPNVSTNDYYSDIYPGDKVSLGSFSAGTKIGFVLFGNGWKTGARKPTKGFAQFYSNPNYNQHGYPQSILTYVPEYDKYLYAFEDIRLYQGNCDYDFNDVVFYVSSDPSSAIDDSNIPNLSDGSDQDGDGILDEEDDFPQDASKAYCTRVQGTSTIAFEDSWPLEADYDFNEMVVAYNFFYHKNSEGKITNLITDMILMANGGQFDNGFGIEFPFSADKVENCRVVRHGNADEQLDYSVINSIPGFESQYSLEGSGSERFIIRYTDNIYEWLTGIDNSRSEYLNTWDTNQVESYTNVDDNGNSSDYTEVHNPPYYRPVEFSLDIKMSTPINEDDFIAGINAKEKVAPFNPFVIQKGVRSHEIHLADYTPTRFADESLFGTGDDDSDPATGKYYKNADNYPWGINVNANFKHMQEGTLILQGYNKLDEWVSTNGSMYYDWTDTSKAGYIIQNKLYEKRVDWTDNDVMFSNFFENVLPLPY